MKIFENVSDLALASLANNQIVAVKEIGEYRVKESGNGITLASSNIAEPINSGTSINVRQFGALGDGVTDDSVAIQSAYGALNAIGGGLLFFPAGVYLIQSTITIYSNILTVGVGAGVSTLKAGSMLPLTSALMVNENIPVNRVRQDENIFFKDLTLDGSGRTYISYPAPGFDTKGPMITLNGVSNAGVTQIEIKGHQSNGGINDLGCRNLRIANCAFHDNGKNDDISSPVFSQAFGSTRKIVDVTKANPAVVTVDAAHAMTNGQSVWIEGVDGLQSVPDGEYTVANVTSTTFELSGIDTSSDSGFADNMLAIAGWAGTTANWVPSEDVIVTDNSFYDNIRSGISFMPAHGGLLTGNTFRNNGESTVFSERGTRINISNNKIQKTTLTDIASSGIEVNLCGDLNVIGNNVEDTALDSIAIQGCVSFNIQSNIIRNAITDNTITYPIGPLSVAAGIDGNVVDKTRCMLLSSLEDAPLSNGNVNGNIVIDTRTTAQASEGFGIGKAGTNDIVYNIDIKDNDLVSSGLAEADRIKVLATSVALPHTMNFKGNKGHFSEGMVLQTATISATGLQTFDVGFVPSMITCEAIFLNANNARTSTTFVVRDRTNITSGTLGYGVRQAADGLESSSTVDIDAENNIVTTDFYRITNGAGTTRATAEFAGWLCDSNNIGVNMNVITADDTVRLTLVFYP